MKSLLFILAVGVTDVLSRPWVNSTGKLIHNDWETLAKETTLRYFNPAKYHTGGTEDEIWSVMGEDIRCNVNDDLTVELGLPEGFDNTKPFKLMTHGFLSEVTGGKTAFVNAWMQTSNLEVNVILVNWPGLAFGAQIVDWESVFYDAAALSSIDVGEYLGHCLAAISSQTGVSGSDMHLVGHSLGAHLMGKAGRTYKQVSGQQISRVSGLDPAGPRFVDGPILSAIPELYENRLNPESASCVDVIHTDASLTPAGVWFEPRLGDLHQLGHMDFYPQGGSGQPGCEFGGPDAFPDCSHNRAFYYFLHSIWEPILFPSMECSDVDACADDQVISNNVVAFMGEQAKSSCTDQRKLYFLEVKDRHWDYSNHM